jgi:tRNA(fMet)-specific endonuclease VapC
VVKTQYLLDTDICIYISRRNNPKVLGRFQQCPEGAMAISVVTYGELCVGAETSTHRKSVLNELGIFTAAVPVLPLNSHVAEVYGRLRMQLQRRGEMIGANDLWIAAHCAHLGLTLVTNNDREFRRIPNLAIENWTN